MMFGWPMRTWVRLATAAGKSKTYLYYFTRVPPGPQSAKLGAFHAAEVFYVFNNLRFGGHPYEDTDRKLADQMSSYWVNFAANGDPNGKALPQWPAYGMKTDIALELGDEVKPRAGLYKQQLDFLDSHFEALRTHKK
jgi:para-nitrobenzyl esterase